MINWLCNLIGAIAFLSGWVWLWIIAAPMAGITHPTLIILLAIVSLVGLFAVIGKIVERHR
jgi:hypothetical protein